MSAPTGLTCAATTPSVSTQLAHIAAPVRTAFPEMDSTAQVFYKLTLAFYLLLFDQTRACTVCCVFMAYVC